MNYIPAELIAQIGAHLPHQDRIRCYQAAKLFSSISFKYKGHYIKFTQGNYREKLSNIVRTMQYVKRIKPNIKEFILCFDGIIDISPAFVLYLRDVFTCGVISFEHIFIKLITCCAKTVNAVLTQCPPKTKVRMNQCTITDHDVVYDFLRTNVYNNHEFQKIMNNAAICKTKHLSIATVLNNINLHNIDVTENNVLELALCTDAQCTDAHKITKIHDHTSGELDLFRKSCLDERHFKKKSRLQQVSIMDNCLQVYSFWTQFAKDLPQNVCYAIKPKDSGALLLIDELKKVGVRNFKYVCPDRKHHLTAMMCRFVSFDYKYDMEKTNGYNGDELSSAEEVYEEMDVVTRQTWYCMTL